MYAAVSASFHTRCFRYFCLICLAALAISAAAQSSSGIPVTTTNRSGDPDRAHGSLYEGFRKPPRKYLPAPVWYWNSTINAAEVKRQIDDYLEHGAQGATIYPAIGLKTRFLSEEWWHIWGEMLPYAREKNFKIGWVPEFNHPDGDARDVWLEPPDQSVVLQGHPEYRMQHLEFVEREVAGPGKIQIGQLPDPVIAVAARKNGPDALDGDSLVDLSKSIHGSSFQAELGPGNWLLTFYPVEPYLGSGAQRVDPLNPDATRRYIDVTLGELTRRFSEYLGSTIDFILLDSEGTYGGPFVWTPGFLDTFQDQKHYDPRKYLPLLLHDGGRITPKFRNDYFDVISEMFNNNFWKLIADWGRAHGVDVVAQTSGDGLQLEARSGGDFMTAQTTQHQFKEPQSVADFEGRRMGCECLLVQGAGTFVSPQKMRMGSNVIGAWGVNYWQQNTSYDELNAEWPPQMGSSQPHWKFFRHYADLVSRFSYMNDGGHHVADVLLYRPIASAVAYSDPAFDPMRKGRARGGFAEYGNQQYGRTAMKPYLEWGDDFSWQVEMDYYGLMIALAQRQKDYDIVNDYYLNRAVFGNGSARLGNADFHAIVIPPLKVISRTAMKNIHEFYKNGGVVVAYGSLPSGSTDEGWGDKQILADVQAVFGSEVGGAANHEKTNHNGGKAFFISHGIDGVIETLDRAQPADFKVIQGSADRIYYIHRVKDGRDHYLVVNDDRNPRQMLLSLRAMGRPEMWNPDSGERNQTVYATRNDRTEVWVELGPWDARYVVFAPDRTKTDVSISHTNLERVETTESTPARIEGRIEASEATAFVEGESHGKKFRSETKNPTPVAAQTLSTNGWTFQPAANRIAVPFAREAVLKQDEGQRLGVAGASYDDGTWELSSLSPEQWTVREWNLIGPFPNVDHHGYNEVFPPEKEPNLNARYAGPNDQDLAWQWCHSPMPEVNINEALALPNRPGVEYALTYVNSPSARRVRAVVAAENFKLFVNGQLVFKVHPLPRYYELRDGFAFKSEVDLKAGSNQIVLKIEHDREPAVFAFRLTDEQGQPVSGINASASQSAPISDEPGSGQQAQGERWYRIQIPPGAREFIMPPRHAIRAAYVNGTPVALTQSSVPLGALNWYQPNTLALELAGDDYLTDSVVFTTGPAEYRLGSWIGTGLAYYSGEASYETTFDLKPELIGKEIELDCGTVGLTAEVWLNGEKVGERVWEPYQLDVAKYLHPGKNTLKIAVTNSDANRRAEANVHRYEQRKRLPGGRAIPFIDDIGPSGLIGPVQLVPFIRTAIDVTDSTK